MVCDGEQEMKDYLVAFKKDYVELKKTGKTDKEIAGLMFIDPHTVARYKKIVFTPDEIKAMRKPKGNRRRITEEQFKIAESNGIERRVVLQRVRVYYWDKQRAITQKKRIR
jgi:hypothetical protein